VQGCGLDSSGSEQSPVVGSCEYSNEPSGSIKDGGFLASSVTTGFSKTLLHGVSNLSPKSSASLFNWV
jgi:hypothetical protein